MPSHPSLRWNNSAHKGTANKIAGFDSNGNASEYDQVAGPTGPEGPQGPQGIQGEQGLQGLTGPQGLQGATGAQGVQGLQGVQGETGLQGLQGIQGIQGEQGIQGVPGNDGVAGTPGSVWREGTGVPSDALGVNGDFYLNDTNGDVYQKAAGIYSLVANIKGVQGETGLQGLQGETGLTGDAGAQGIQGVQGDIGLTGDPGPAGIVWRGTWSGATAYDVRDAVTSGGSSYICISGHTNQVPPNITYWNVLANKGDTGAQGIQGEQGIQGDIGPAHVTTAGDLEYHDGTNPNRLPIGLNGDILTVDTTLPGKIRWAPINETYISYAALILTSDQVKALRAAPITCIPALGAGKVIEFISAVLALDYNSAAYVFGATDDLQFKYIDGAGIPVSLVAETTGWLNATGDRLRIVTAQGSPTFTKAQSDNKAIVLHNIGSAEITTGNSQIFVYIAYRVHTIGW